MISNQVRSVRGAAFVVFLMLSIAADRAFGASLDLTTATLVIDDRSAVCSLRFADGTQWPASDRPAFVLETKAGSLVPKSVQLDGDRLAVTFEGGSIAEFSVRRQPGLAVFRLTKLAPSQGVERLQLFRLAAPAEARAGSTLNAAYTDRWVSAVMAAEPNVRAFVDQASGARGDRTGCKHTFAQSSESKVGRGAAKFSASCNEQPGGWSVRGKTFPSPLNLTGCKAIRAWVHGDGKGEHLKIQLLDGTGGYRDNYLPIDFTGWRQVTLTDSPINTLRYGRVAAMNFYYNSIPASQSVECSIDQVEAIVERDGKEEAVLLEDFEAADSPLWAAPAMSLNVVTQQRYGIEPAAFGVLAAPREEFLSTVERFEREAGVPSPRPGGEWNKRSPWIKRSYFFLTDFRESQFDEALALARRGGFDMILLGQESWSRGTGHYEINRDRFPDGLEGLKRAVRRFKEAGFKVGLHFLGPSIYAPDPYITPVPDPRLVKGAKVALAADVDAKADFLPTFAAPQEFPAEDGGYEGAGTVLQIGDELIQYLERSLKPPYGFLGCRRGHLGTKPTAHQQGKPVAHLVRSYGYHMFDMNTSLLDEVAGHFARVANACEIDMIYFDGSERLQGDHWYYNARLHKAFYDKLANKNTLLQASSYSHFSWHLMARSASADGHGDLKGYLEERSPWFDSFARDGMPLDIGWYYGYDPQSTLDQYEYILGATIGYDCSMSFQVSCAAAARHPFTNQILDLIARYEKLRLSGSVPEEMRARLRIDRELGGKKTPEERAKLLDRRRDYRLVGPPGEERFQRVVYGPWQELKPSEGPSAELPLQVKNGPAKIGAQVHVQSGPWLAPGPSYNAPGAVMLESFDDVAPYTADPKDRDVRAIGPGQAGSTSPGVAQRLELSEQDAREGARFAVYSATSTQPDIGGWSYLGRQFAAPLDLSSHRGIGFWLRGDGNGGQFKLQLTDGRGATDYYVANDYVGWRYQQLARPAKDPIDYKSVRTLGLYYNSLPGKSAVACGIDGVKALPALDRQALVDPYFEVGGKRLAFQGSLGEGEYLFFWAGEPASRFAPGLKEPEQSDGPCETISLEPDRHAVHFGFTGTLNAPVRIRVVQELPAQ